MINEREADGGGASSAIVDPRDHGVFLSGRVRFGNGVLDYEAPIQLYECELESSNSIGIFSYVNQRSSLYDADIGRYCSIGPDVCLGAYAHPLHFLTTHPLSFNWGRHENEAEPGFASHVSCRRLISFQHSHIGNCVRTLIGHDVWIGRGCTILRGVRIGTGAVVGAGAVVTKDIAPYAIMTGVPARCNGYRFDRSTISRLLGSRWWEYDLSEYADKKRLYEDVNAALDYIEMETTVGGLRVLHPPKRRMWRVGNTLYCKEVE